MVVWEDSFYEFGMAWQSGWIMIGYLPAALAPVEYAGVCHERRSGAFAAFCAVQAPFGIKSSSLKSELANLDLLGEFATQALMVTRKCGYPSHPSNGNAFHGETNETILRDPWACPELVIAISPGKKYFAYGKMTVVLGETVVTIIVAQLMCLVLGGQKQLTCNMGMWPFSRGHASCPKKFAQMWGGAGHKRSPQSSQC